MRTFLESTFFKLSLLLTLSVAAAAYTTYSYEYGVMEGCSDVGWRLYKNQFQKQYRSTVEDARRRVIFCSNMQMIYDHNERYKRGEVTFEMGVNQFADLTGDEFRLWLHGGSMGGGSIGGGSSMRTSLYY